MVPVFTSMMLGREHGALANVLLGIMLGLYPLGQFFGSPVLGALSDRLGRKPVIVPALLVSVFCYIFISLSLTHHWLFVLYLFLFLAGLVDGTIAITQGSITDATSEDQRSRYFGYIYVVSSAAFIVGSFLSGSLSRFGISTAFWVITLILFLTFICVTLFFHETRHLAIKRDTKLFGAFMNLTDIIHNQALRYYYCTNFILYLSSFGFLRVYAMYVENTYHVGIALLSTVVAYVAIPFIVMNLLVVPLFMKLSWKNPKTLTMASSWFMGIFMILIVIPKNFNSLWITLFLTTAALALTMTYSAVMLSLMASLEKQGAVMGNNQSLLSLAGAFAAFSAGGFAAIATELPLVLFGLTALIGAVLLFRKS